MGGPIRGRNPLCEKALLIGAGLSHIALIACLSLALIQVPAEALEGDLPAPVESAVGASAGGLVSMAGEAAAPILKDRLQREDTAKEEAVPGIAEDAAPQASPQTHDIAEANGVPADAAAKTVPDVEAPQDRADSAGQTAPSDFDYIFSAKTELGSYTAHDDGSMNEWQPGYYVAHRDSAAGTAIASMEPGDRVSVNGRTLTIEAVITTESEPEYISLRDFRIGRDTVAFQTCGIPSTFDIVAYGHPDVPETFGFQSARETVFDDGRSAEYDEFMAERDVLLAWQAGIMSGADTGLEAYEAAVADYEARLSRWEAAA